jgi:hypothetical protein
MSNGHNGHQSSREIERDVERTRAHMAETLEELRSRMSPGQILDEVLGYARDTGGGKTLGNLGRTVQDNPAPLLLIGAGVAWMMMGGNGQRYPARREPVRPRESRSGEGLGAAAGAVGTVASDVGNGVWQTAADIGDAAVSGMRDLGDAARRTGDAAASSMRDLGDAASRTGDAAISGVHDLRDAAYRTGDAAYRQGRDIGSSIASMIGDQPLVLGALGLALGAALGAALPETETENRLMGETSDQLKKQAKDVAESTYEQVKAAASDAISGEHRPEDDKTKGGEIEGKETDLAAPTVPSGGTV